MKHERHYSAPFALTSRSLHPVRSFLRSIIIVSALSVLAACGNTEVETNNDTGTGGGNTGPAYKGTPLDDDVLKFANEFWKPLAGADRCGQCHIKGGQASNVAFVQSDINKAYTAAISSSSQGLIIDRSNPSNSRAVVATAGGHQCWGSLSDIACADIIETYIGNWTNGSAASGGRSISLSAPRIFSPGQSRNFPATAVDGSPSFKDALYDPILVPYCSECHSDSSNTPQSPFFASGDPDVAYAAAKSKINLDTPKDSRFVARVLELHNCWSNAGCIADAATMENAIIAFAEGIVPTEIDPKLITSKAMTFADATLASGGNRYENNQIALWEFKTGVGNQAFDTSGIEPAMTLTFNGSVSWILGYGVDFTKGGYAKAKTTTSEKLSDRIGLTNSYSIEAWVIPANVTQEKARIISYTSGSGKTRNFSLSQTMYQYEYFNRSTTTDPAGETSLLTLDTDEDLQSALQHVVVTFDPINGRRVYINGIYTDDPEPSDSGGSLLGWDNSFFFALGSEGSNVNNIWSGKLRLVAIHNSALTLDQVNQNFNVGVGQKYFMLFSVGELIRPSEITPETPSQDFILFETELYDNTAYLFTNPIFISLDESYTPQTSIPLEGMRIGINGREAVSGQVYGNLNTTIKTPEYTPNGQKLSRLGTVIAIEKGPEDDVFFLSFENFNSNTNRRTEPDPVAPQLPADPEPVSSIGIKTFDEINASMSFITEIPITQSDVATTYGSYKQQLPSIEDINAFLPSHQMAIAQLAMQYCNVRVSLDKDPSTPVDEVFFKGFDFSQNALTAFTGATADASKLLIIEPLLTGIMNMDSTASHNLATQADPAVITELLGSANTLNLIDDTRDANSSTDYDYSSLINTMTSCASCSNDAKRTEEIVIATCAATLGSAMILIQ